MSFSGAKEDMKIFNFNQDLSSKVCNNKSLNLVRSLDLTTPTDSPATDDLNMKIASVKKVWDVMGGVSENSEQVVPPPNSFPNSQFAKHEVDQSTGVSQPPPPHSTPHEASSSDLLYTAHGQNESTNVCKVKPQQQPSPTEPSIPPKSPPPASTALTVNHGGAMESANIYQTLTGAAAFGGAIPSPTGAT